MNRRLLLHDLLVETLGSSNVYFQPPPTVKMQYPAIVYTRNKVNSIFANNKIYKHMVEYTVTVIDPNPDSDILVQVLSLPMCSSTRHFTADNLNHDVFNIYF